MTSVNITIVILQVLRAQFNLPPSRYFYRHHHFNARFPKIYLNGSLRVHPIGFYSTSVHANMQNSAVPFLKMLECVSGFENFEKIFWDQDIQMWQNLDCILKFFRSKSFFVNFNREFNLSFMETCDLQMSSATEAQLG